MLQVAVGWVIAVVFNELGHPIGLFLMGSDICSGWCGDLGYVCIRLGFDYTCLLPIVDLSIYVRLCIGGK